MKNFILYYLWRILQRVFPSTKKSTKTSLIKKKTNKNNFPKGNDTKYGDIPIDEIHKDDNNKKIFIKIPEVHKYSSTFCIKNKTFEIPQNESDTKYNILS